jgi:hypothetical protein
MLIRIAPGQNAKTDRTGNKPIDPVIPVDNFAFGWQNRRNLHKVLLRYTRLTERIFKRFQFVPVLTNPFGQKYPRRNKINHLRVLLVQKTAFTFT